MDMQAVSAMDALSLSAASSSPINFSVPQTFLESRIKSSRRKNTEHNMSDDIKAKLDSLKTLRGEMKDWKKDDLRKKKGIKDPEEVEVKDEKKE